MAKARSSKTAAISKAQPNRPTQWLPETLHTPHQVDGVWQSPSGRHISHEWQCCCDERMNLLSTVACDTCDHRRCKDCPKYNRFHESAPGFGIKQTWSDAWDWNRWSAILIEEGTYYDGCTEKISAARGKPIILSSTPAISQFAYINIDN